MLSITATALAEGAKVGIASVKRFESGRPVQPATVAAIESALIDAGIELIGVGERSFGGREGVRLAAKVSAQARY